MIAHLPAQVEMKSGTVSSGSPVIVGGLPHERKRVLDCSEGAVEVGVAVGMSLREAHSICPEADFVPARQEAYEEAFAGVLTLLDHFSPVVERESLETAYLDIGGMDGIFGSEEELANRIRSEIAATAGLEAGVGVAGTRFVAHAAAQQASTGVPVIVTEGTEVEFLRDLPVDLLPVSQEVKRDLELLGLRTLGQLASLPVGALEARFGTEGAVAHRLARGIDPCPIVPRPIPLVLEAEWSGENSVETIDGLLAIVDSLLEAPLEELVGRGLACGQIRLRFHSEREEGWSEAISVISLKTPTRSKREMLGRVRHRLEKMQFPGGVSTVWLTLAELGSEPTSQSPLFSGQGGERDREILWLARWLRRRLGKASIKRVIPLDPSSRIPERRAALADFPQTDE